MKERIEFPLVGLDDDATRTVKALNVKLRRKRRKTPKTREAYLELMRNWRDLADEIEHFERVWLDREGI